MPLTYDSEANPFRFDAKTGQGSQLLFHCILALCYKHMNRDTGFYDSEVKTHKKQAFQMLRDMERASEPSLPGATFLDAVLILMTLDVSFIALELFVACAIDLLLTSVEVRNISTWTMDVVSQARA